MKTLELNELHLVELDFTEMNETDGGFGFELAAGLMAGLIINAVYDLGKAYGATIE
jgi:hypothetical protein